MSITIRGNQENINLFDNAKGVTKTNGKSIDARGLTMGNSTDERIEAKRALARKQAIKLVGDAWKRDENGVAQREELSDEKTKTLDKIRDLISKKKDIDNTIENYRQEYGVDIDSQEQKDLELLQKYQNNRNGSSFDSFSKDEVERLKELQNTPLSDYQKKALEQNGAKGTLDIEIQKLTNEVAGITESITDAKIDQLKSQDMLNAGEAADSILEASDKEILGMMIQEGKDSIDEKQEEEKEKAEEASEKREEQQERIDEAKENRREQQEILEADMKTDKLENSMQLQKTSDSQMDEAQKQVNKILKDNNMINEDIKGIEIDLNF